MSITPIELALLSVAAFLIGLAGGGARAIREQDYGRALVLLLGSPLIAVSIFLITTLIHA